MRKIHIYLAVITAITLLLLSSCREDFLNKDYPLIQTSVVEVSEQGALVKGVLRKNKSVRSHQVVKKCSFILADSDEPVF